MPCKLLRDLSLPGQRVLMRVDFNVPQNRDGSIASDARIRASLPSIEWVLKAGASLILMSHLGRPKGPNPKESLAPCAERLSELLHREVLFATDAVGPVAQKMASALKPTQILVLENLRFDPAEEAPEKDPTFAKKLAALGDCYVNDAFAAAHRAHSSTTTIAQYFPGRCAIGLSMEREIEAFSPLLGFPKRPFYAIIGGAKISTKAGVIQNLLKKVDALFLGGGMTYTFLKAQGIEIGDSIVEPDCLELARNLLKSAREKLFFPSDLAIADAFEAQANRKIVKASAGIPAGWQGMDIGPETVKEWSKELQKAATVFWNGPLGVCEMAPFAAGTKGIATCLANSKAKVVVGGGDSVAAIEQMGLEHAFAHLSMGGGASLEYLEYGHLPAIDALETHRVY